MKAHYRIRFKELNADGTSVIKAFYLSAINPEDEFYKIWNGANVKILTIKKV